MAEQADTGSATLEQSLQENAGSGDTAEAALAFLLDLLSLIVSLLVSSNRVPPLELMSRQALRSAAKSDQFWWSMLHAVKVFFRQSL
ncbi:hypothetical protein PoB_001946800 [Plakobranchus ocellatus]|uniref:Uncharacterized protein n=1 Tax=Plakobranchus ocellatus TaxID=259542 RepID=A0AAV3ZES8_9GAST|nr:hypothetical protein PoB_001946800 [Plakobranchus ocellatus]